MKAIGGVVLGAGSSRRFGADKLIQSLEGKPLVRHVAETALAAHLAEVVVVVRPGDEELVASLPSSRRLRIVENPEHHLGMSSSVKCGLLALGRHIQAALILLGDEPEVSTAAIGTIIDAYISSHVEAVRTSYRGRLGHPVVLDRALWPEILREQGDMGARGILDRCRSVEIFELGERAPIDVDTREDLAALRRRLSRS